MLRRSPTRFQLNSVQTTSGTPAVKTAGVYDVVGRQGAQLKFFQGGLGQQPQEKGGGSQLKNASTPIKFFASEPGARHVRDPIRENRTSLGPFAATWHSFKENLPQTLRGRCVAGRRDGVIPISRPGVLLLTLPPGSLRFFGYSHPPGLGRAPAAKF